MLVVPHRLAISCCVPGLPTLLSHIRSMFARFFMVVEVVLLFSIFCMFFCSS